MTLDHDGPLGSRLRAFDVPVPPGLGARVLAADAAPVNRRRHLPRRAAFAAAAMAAFLIANASALYVAPAYALALASAPVAGGPSAALLSAAGLSASDGTTPIGSTAVAAGKRVTLVEGTADTLRTVLVFDVPPGMVIPPDDITVTDQFGRSISDSGFAEAWAGGGITSKSIGVTPGPGDTRFGMMTPGALFGRSGQLVIILPPVSGEAARVGARLTLRIDAIASNTGPGSKDGAPPWRDALHGPWTLTANLVVQPASNLQQPPPQTIDGTTWTLSSLGQAGGALEVRGTVTGPDAERLTSGGRPAELRTASGGRVAPLYFEYAGTPNRLRFSFTFKRPAAGTNQLRIGQATFTIPTS
jgi:hypothetical protein